jgi:Tfp pilus assembly protein PilX
VVTREDEMIIGMKKMREAKIMRQGARNDREEGSVLILALIMLVLLTIMGIQASTTSTIEIQIAGNERNYRQNFYRAEAAAMEGIQDMDDRDLELSPPTSLHVTISDSELASDSYWAANSAQSLDTEARYMSGNQRIVPGASLDMSKSTVYEYDVYGRSTRNRGKVIIEVGYRKAF